MIKFHQKYFNESILFDQVNADEIRRNNKQNKNIDGIENKITRFQIYPEMISPATTKPHYIQKHIQKYLSNTKKSFDMKTGKLNINATQT